MSKDYYNILGVSSDTSQDDLKKAYRKLAHQYHPDKDTGDEEKFKEINEAYQVLKDPDKRQKYDQFGSNFEQQGGWQGATGGANWEDIMQGFKTGGFQGNAQGFHVDLGDIFGDFFGGGRSGRRASRGRDFETSLEVEFKDAVFGTERTVQLEKFDKCSHCKGNRAEPGTSIIQCKTCGGTGTISQTRNTILGVMQSESRCPSCGGEGKIPKQNCSSCNGDGMERTQKKIEIKIPAGIRDGETIRLQGQGEISDDLKSYGDLYVKVDVREHYKFKRDSDDIYSTEPISFTQAALGDKMKVDTIDGTVELKVPAGTASETTFKLKKKGVPHLRAHGRGDHFVKVKVVVPEKLSRKSKRLLKELQEENA